MALLHDNADYEEFCAYQRSAFHLFKALFPENDSASPLTGISLANKRSMLKGYILQSVLRNDHFQDKFENSYEGASFIPYLIQSADGQRATRQKATVNGVEDVDSSDESSAVVIDSAYEPDAPARDFPLGPLQTNTAKARRLFRLLESAFIGVTATAFLPEASQLAHDWVKKHTDRFAALCKKSHVSPPDSRYDHVLMIILTGLSRGPGVLQKEFAEEEFLGFNVVDLWDTKNGAITFDQMAFIHRASFSNADTFLKLASIFTLDSLSDLDTVQNDSLAASQLREGAKTAADKTVAIMATIQARQLEQAMEQDAYMPALETKYSRHRTHRQIVDSDGEVTEIPLPYGHLTSLWDAQSREQARRFPSKEKHTVQSAIDDKLLSLEKGLAQLPYTPPMFANNTIDEDDVDESFHFAMDLQGGRKQKDGTRKASIRKLVPLTGENQFMAARARKCFEAVSQISLSLLYVLNEYRRNSTLSKDPSPALQQHVAALEKISEAQLSLRRDFACQYNLAYALQLKSEKMRRTINNFRSSRTVPDDLVLMDDEVLYDAAFEEKKLRKDEKNLKDAFGVHVRGQVVRPGKSGGNGKRRPNDQRKPPRPPRPPRRPGRRQPNGSNRDRAKDYDRGRGNDTGWRRDRGRSNGRYRSVSRSRSRSRSPPARHRDRSRRDYQDRRKREDNHARGKDNDKGRDKGRDRGKGRR